MHLALRDLMVRTGSSAIRRTRQLTSRVLSTASRALHLRPSARQAMSWGSIAESNVRAMLRCPSCEASLSFGDANLHGVAFPCPSCKQTLRSFYVYGFTVRTTELVLSFSFYYALGVRGLLWLRLSLVTVPAVGIS